MLLRRVRGNRSSRASVESDSAGACCGHGAQRLELRSRRGNLRQISPRRAARRGWHGFGLARDEFSDAASTRLERQSASPNSASPKPLADRDCGVGRCIRRSVVRRRKCAAGAIDTAPQCASHDSRGRSECYRAAGALGGRRKNTGAGRREKRTFAGRAPSAVSPSSARCFASRCQRTDRAQGRSALGFARSHSAVLSQLDALATSRRNPGDRKRSAEAAPIPLASLASQRRQRAAGMRFRRDRPLRSI